MTQQTIGVGAFPNDTTGDPLLTAFQKVNGNFTELYNRSISASVLNFGADPTGVADSSAAFAAAFLAGTSVYVPTGRYLVGSLVMPATFGFMLFGDGTSSVLIQKADGNPLLSWSTAGINYTEGYIERLAFKGTSGTNHTINTSGVGGITLEDLYFTDTPAGFSSIYANGAAATYMHDQRFRNIQIYSNTAGHSGIRFGPLSADSEITGFIMNGNFQVSYGLYLENGAQTIKMTDSHPYNCAVNTLFGAGNNGQCSFEHVTFDNATNDIIVMNGTTYGVFTNCWFQSIKAAKNGVTLTNSSGFVFDNCRWSGAVSSGFAINETGTSNTNFAYRGIVTPSGNFAAGIFNFIGANSFATGLAGFNPLGLNWNLSGCAQAAQAQNTTQYLGVNGSQAASLNTNYVCPQNATLTTVFIAVDSTPAAGQTYVFTIFDGAATLGTLTINNGGFGGTVTLNSAVAKNDQIFIRSVFSATSGAANIRYTINFTA